MSHPLLPDLSATIDVDPIECILEGDDLEIYKAEVKDRVLFKVGYIKPAKFNELRFRLAGLKKPETDAADFEFTLKAMDVYRDILKWSLKGWNLDIPWETEGAEVRGHKVQIASEAVIEAIEARGWLHVLGVKALEYNTLDDGTKKK